MMHSRLDGGVKLCGYSIVSSSWTFFHVPRNRVLVYKEEKNRPSENIQVMKLHFLQCKYHSNTLQGNSPLCHPKRELKCHLISKYSQQKLLRLLFKYILHEIFNTELFTHDSRSFSGRRALIKFEFKFAVISVLFWTHAFGQIVYLRKTFT